MTHVLRLNQQVYRIHKWLGLPTGLVLLLIGLTGSLVAFYDELNEIQFGGMLRVEPRGETLSHAALFAAARGARPAAFVYGCQIERQPGRSRTFYYEEGGDRYGAIFIDPHSGRVLGQAADLEALSSLVLRLHYSLLLRPWGELLVGIVGFTFIASSVTGVWVYRHALARPFRRRVRWSGGSRAVSKDLHTLIGLATLAFNLFLAVSGAYMMLYAFSPSYLLGDGERMREARPGAALGLPVDELHARARRAMPALDVQSVYLPRHEGDPVSVWGNATGTPFWLGGRSTGRSRVDLHPGTGAVLAVVDINHADLATRYENVLYELHFGQFGGWPVKLLYALVGLAPGALSITGFVLWWKRRRTAEAPAAAFAHSVEKRTS